MQPSFNDGDFIIYLKRIFSVKPYPVSSLLIVDHPKYGTILKRVLSADNNSGYRLISDNPTGVSSEELGTCPLKSIKGRVIYHIESKNR